MPRVPRSQLYYWNLNTNINNLQIALTRLMDGVEGTVKEHLEFERKMIYREAIAEVPYDSGRLMRSIRVFNWQHKGKFGITATAFAVNPETGEEYSIEQHENPFYKHRNGRKYHYLYDPYRRASIRLEDKIDHDTDVMVRQFESIASEGDTKSMSAADIYGMAKSGSQYRRTRPGSVRYDRMWTRGKIYRGDPVHQAEMMASTYSSKRPSHYKVEKDTPGARKRATQRAGYWKT